MAPTDDDFASMFEATARSSAGARKLKVGEPVDGVVAAIGKDCVFLDIGARSEGRIPIEQLRDRQGKLSVGVGDRLRARVAGVTRDAIHLVTSLGRHGSVDLAAIELAAATGAPIEGTFSKSVKGGLEVEIGGVRAFCPASMAELTYMQDLEPLVGQKVAFKVIEVRDGGRSVIVSRKAILEDERAERARGLRSQLQIGAELDGTVTSVQPYGAFVDLGGLEGLVHVSELGHGRVDKVSDVVRVGESVRVRIVGIEPRAGKPDDLKISLSMRFGEAAAGGEPSGKPGKPEAVAVDEVLTGKVAHVASYGVFVDTPKGRGMVPLRELGLPPGADPKRSFPMGKEVQVVLLSRDDATGRLRFSVSGVARAEERSNYREFASGGTSSGGKAEGGGGKASGLGSLGDLLRGKLPEVEPSDAPKKARKPAQKRSS
ncbi:MAG: S1 RNA-binding domain-containing protein [Nannocystaceae bacterium]